MATYLLTVERVESDGHGHRLSPGIRLTQTTDQPTIASMAQGARLELRRPDGSVSRTTLLTYGVSAWRGDDGALYLDGDPADAEIMLTLPADLPPNAIPVGAEVWLIDS